MRKRGGEGKGCLPIDRLKNFHVWFQFRLQIFKQIRILSKTPDKKQSLLLVSEARKEVAVEKTRVSGWNLTCIFCL